jgi:hypothetical protein
MNAKTNLNLCQITRIYNNVKHGHKVLKKNLNMILFQAWKLWTCTMRNHVCWNHIVLQIKLQNNYITIRTWKYEQLINKMSH